MGISAMNAAPAADPVPESKEAKAQRKERQRQIRSEARKAKRQAKSEAKIARKANVKPTGKWNPSCKAEMKSKAALDKLEKKRLQALARSKRFEAEAQRLLTEAKKAAAVYEQLTRHLGIKENEEDNKKAELPKSDLAFSDSDSDASSDSDSDADADTEDETTKPEPMEDVTPTVAEKTTRKNVESEETKEDDTEKNTPKKDKKKKDKRKIEVNETPSMDEDAKEEQPTSTEDPKEEKKKKKRLKTTSEKTKEEEPVDKKSKKSEKRKREEGEDDDEAPEEPACKKEKKDKKDKKSKEKKEKKEKKATTEEGETEKVADVEQWNVGELEGGSARQDKFLRLLGGKKAGAKTGSSSHVSGHKSDSVQAEADIQRQFEAGMMLKESGQRRRGLGA